MASYNDLSFNSGEYIKQYAGIPLDQIQHTADTLSTRHYQNLGSASQLQILANQLKAKALPGAQAYFDTHIGAIGQTIDDIAKNGGENATARVNALATAFQGDPNMLRAGLRAEEVGKMEQKISDLTAQGFNPLYDKERLKKMKNAPIGSPEYLSAFVADIEPERQHFKEQTEILDQFRDQSTEGPLRAAWGAFTPEQQAMMSDPNNPQGKVLLRSITNSGVYGDRYTTLTNHAWNVYQGTPSYRQKMKYEYPELNDVEKQVKIKEEFEHNAFLHAVHNVSSNYTQVGTGGGGTTKTPNIIPRITLPGNVAYESVVRPGFWQSLKEYGINELAIAIGDISGSTSPEDKAALEKRQTDILNGNAVNPEETKRIINLFRIALSVNGQATGHLSEKELLEQASTDKGKSTLKNYIDTYVGPRLFYPTVGVEPSDADRKEIEKFVLSTLDTREFMDDEGNYFPSLRDGKDVRDELGELNNALHNGKAIYNGILDPNHTLTQKGGDSFSRGIKITVPSEDGTDSKVYYIGQPSNTISREDINQNVIYNKANTRVGGWAKVGQGFSVLKMAPPQTEEYWRKYGAAQAVGDSNLTRETFASPDVVLIQDPDGKVWVAPSEALAGKQLKQWGINLSMKK